MKGGQSVTEDDEDDDEDDDQQTLTVVVVVDVEIVGGCGREALSK